jgi:hypothetical protein
MLIIRNPGHRNALTCDIQGAPRTVEGVGPGGAKPLNGRWSIPPNEPATEVRASADFQGHTVTIINSSDPETVCFVLTHVPGS